MGGSVKNQLRQLLKAARERLAPRRIAFYRMPSRPPRTLYLTFDDGPHPHHTPVILDLLRQHHAQATFFVVGELVERFPEIVRRTVEEGHTVGNHTYSHPDFKRCDFDQIHREMARGSASIEGITGERVALFRPPKGHLYPRGLRAALLHRLRVAFWTVDSMDYKWDDPDRIANRLKEMRLRAGDVLLFHDDYGHTLKALPRILEHLTSQGWSLRPLPSPSLKPASRRAFPSVR